jgi:hypothetical protein
MACILLEGGSSALLLRQRSLLSAANCRTMDAALPQLKRLHAALPTAAAAAAGGADWGLAEALEEGSILGPRLLFTGAGGAAVLLAWLPAVWPAHACSTVVMLRLNHRHMDRLL